MATLFFHLHIAYQIAGTEIQAQSPQMTSSEETRKLYMRECGSHISKLMYNNECPFWHGNCYNCYSLFPTLISPTTVRLVV